MLTFVIEGETHEVTADHFKDLVDVGVRIIKDAARGVDVSFYVSSLHSSAPTIQWAPRPTKANVDVDHAFNEVFQRIEEGVEQLEVGKGVPNWMTDTTANALYQATGTFGESEVYGLTFARDGHPRRLTRHTYRTLDRVLHEETETIGAVTGLLVTVTLTHGPRVTITDDVYGKGVRCYVTEATLREAGGWVGTRVVATGRINRDYLGQPKSVGSAKLEQVLEKRRVTVAEAANLYRSGPPVAEFLREQRGG